MLETLLGPILVTLPSPKNATKAAKNGDGSQIGSTSWDMIASIGSSFKSRALGVETREMEDPKDAESGEIEERCEGKGRDAAFLSGAWAGGNDELLLLLLLR